MASRAVISDPLYCAPSTTTTPRGRPATIRLRTGKFSGAGCVRAQWKFADDRPALQHFFVQFLVFLRVANVDASAKNSYGTPVGVHGSLVTDGVNSTRLWEPLSAIERAVPHLLGGWHPKFSGKDPRRLWRKRAAAAA